MNVYLTPAAVILALCIQSCSEKTAVDNPDEHIIVTDTCMCADLERADVLLNNGKPYNGICLDLYPNSVAPFMATAITKGKPIRHFYFDRAGNLTHEEKSSGQVNPVERLKCLCTELEEKEEASLGGKQKVYYLNGKKFHGECEVYYPDSVSIAAKRNYHLGLIHGRSTTFDKNGSPILHQEYEKGKYIEDIVP